MVESSGAGTAVQTWTPLNDGLTNRNVLALAIDPSNPARLYAGTNGSGVFEYLDSFCPWILYSWPDDALPERRPLRSDDSLGHT